MRIVLIIINTSRMTTNRSGISCLIIRYKGQSRPRRHVSLRDRLQQMLKEKFDHVIGRFLKDREKVHLQKKTGSATDNHRADSEDATPQSNSADRQQKLPGRLALVEDQRANCQTRITHADHWTPLIKVKAPAVPAQHASSEESGCGRFNLAGLCILCVGGRAALYPAYRRLVETSGGCFLIYRGDLREKVSHLPTLLTRADAVICPVDCVNHAIYFAIKRYCTRFGKPCAMLERSGLPTFRKGVEILAAGL